MIKMLKNQQSAWNAFCPTGAGGGVDPTCGKGGTGSFDRDARISDSKSAASGGRASKEGELDAVYHQTAPASLIKILKSGEIKTVRQISTELADEAYGDTHDGGDYVYTGLTRQATSYAAIATGVHLELNLSKESSRTVVQPNIEKGIALVHGPISTDRISSIKIGRGLSERETPKDLRKALVDAGFSYSSQKAKWTPSKKLA